QIPMQFDVIVECIRNTRRLFNRWNLARCFRRELDSSLDLADFLRVLVDGPLIGSTKIFLQTLQLTEQRIENASALLHAGISHFRSGAAAEQAFENNLRIQFHRKRSDALYFLPMIVAPGAPRNRVGVRAAIALTAVTRAGVRILHG